ncbi:MAG: glycosyltransferase [Cyanobacteria bacterium RM1_2_2]|nr:glycosyltransferase [Cyanobacteria bacterium RM1_2_2]
MFVDFSPVSLVHILLLAAALVLLAPSAVFLSECFAALLPPSQKLKRSAYSPKIAVLVPAHNEAMGIQPVLESLSAQVQMPNRLVVIADNCTDQTAQIARSTGVTVIERQDTERRGKGYALDYGLKFLAADPPDVVIVVDADCEVQPGTLDRIAESALLTGRPTQAVYLMELPAHPKPKDAVSALAFLVKNWVRPQGLHRLGLPGILTGTGMAFPWSVIQSVSLASGNIVEDMQLSMDLAIAGYPTIFCPETRVIGLLPQQDQAAKSQRTRWEHGHLQTMRAQVPPLLKAAIQQKRFDLLAIALDLSIPPLSLLIMLWLAVTFAAVMAGFLTQFWLPTGLMVLEGAMLLAAILVAWVRFGRADLPASTLLAVPFYVLWKIPLYVAFLVKPQTKWVRTERDRIDAVKIDAAQSESDLA